LEGWGVANEPDNFFENVGFGIFCSGKYLGSKNSSELIGASEYLSTRARSDKNEEG
jgi:hypothetical protein